MQELVRKRHEYAVRQAQEAVKKVYPKGPYNGNYWAVFWAAYNKAHDAHDQYQ